MRWDATAAGVDAVSRNRDQLAEALRLSDKRMYCDKSEQKELEP